MDLARVRAYLAVIDQLRRSKDPALQRYANELVTELASPLNQIIEDVLLPIERTPSPTYPEKVLRHLVQQTKP